MKTGEIFLEPRVDIDGTGPRWCARSGAPWFRLVPRRPLAGRWARLVWSTGLLERVCRPVLRFVLDDETRDIFLPAAPFGRADFIVFVPFETREILLSPCNRAGEFGFRVERLDTIPALAIRWRALMCAPGLALWGMGANLIGRPGDARALLRDALARRSPAAYARWRAEHSRAFEPDGIDAAPAQQDSGHLRILCPITPEDLPRLDGFAEALPSADGWGVEILALCPPESLAGAQAILARLGCGRAVPEDVGQTELIADLTDEALVCLIPPGARFEPLALRQLARANRENPDSAFLYGEEERFSAQGTLLPAAFKPGFDPLSFEAAGLLREASFIRAGAIRAGAARLARESAGLRLSVPGIEAGVSLGRVLLRVPAGRTAPALSAGFIFPARADQPECAIIIPTRDRLDLLKPCVDSILAKSTGPFRIVIVDNGSVEPATLAYFDTLSATPGVEVLKAPGPFNFSALCNRGAELVTSPILIFLNNDTEVINADWLDQTRRAALDPDVGAVGGTLLYRNGRVQHGGCVIGMGGRAGHFEHGSKAEDAGYFGRAGLTHQVSAVTGAFLAVERRKFEAIGGFDAQNLPIDLNDIDLCLRLGEAGFKTILLASCRLYHYESASRGHPRNTDKVYARERAYFSQRWFSRLRDDPFFSPLLSLYDSDASLG